MAGNESTRRAFLKRIGLVATTAAITTSGFAQVNNLVTDAKQEDALTPAQREFMAMYTKWLEAFHNMAKFQKVDAMHPENNKKLVALSEEAKVWQDDLIEHMRDENFARHYMMVTERVTNAI